MLCCGIKQSFKGKIICFGNSVLLFLSEKGRGWSCWVSFGFICPFLDELEVKLGVLCSFQGLKSVWVVSGCCLGCRLCSYMACHLVFCILGHFEEFGCLRHLKQDPAQRLSLCQCRRWGVIIINIDLCLSLLRLLSKFIVVSIHSSFLWIAECQFCVVHLLVFSLILSFVWFPLDWALSILSFSFLWIEAPTFLYPLGRAPWLNPNLTSQVWVQPKLKWDWVSHFLLQGVCLNH